MFGFSGKKVFESEPTRQNSASAHGEKGYRSRGDNQGFEAGTPSRIVPRKVTV
jgi:hypothetical protein